jgi:HSP20 family molecular chaperone IbpA
MSQTYVKLAQPSDKCRKGKWIMTLSFALNGYLTEHEVILRCAIPGLSESSLKILLTHDTQVAVSGKVRKDLYYDTGEAWLEEREYGSIKRMIELPVPVYPYGIRTVWQNGLFDIFLIRKLY